MVRIFLSFWGVAQLVCNIMVALARELTDRFREISVDVLSFLCVIVSMTHSKDRATWSHERLFLTPGGGRGEADTILHAISRDSDLLVVRTAKSANLYHNV